MRRTLLLSGREARRRAVFGLSTILGLRPKGFFIPYRYADLLPAAADRAPYPMIECMFAKRSAVFLRLLAAVDSSAPLLAAFGNDPPPEPHWRQDWFPRMDAAVAYTIVRRLQPRRLMEVGAGHSTRFFARAVRDGGLATSLSAIDPQPRADLSQLDVQLLAKPVQAVGADAFAGLAAGDILSIDSSHILMPGTDVDFLLNRVLPRLPAGVVVHIHDIFLPDDYPAAWGWRGYNEQLGVATLLQGGGWKVMWSSRYVFTRLQAGLSASTVSRLPLPAGAIESSLWLCKRRAGRSSAPA